MAAVRSDALARLERSLVDLQQGLTQEQSAEFPPTLSNVAVRLEQAAEMLARIVRLSNPAATLKTVPLTPRELEILEYLAEGWTNGEIAAKCWVSENTVKFHMKNIFRKLEVRDRGQATMIARSMQQPTR